MHKVSTSVQQLRFWSFIVAFACVALLASCEKDGPSLLGGNYSQISRSGATIAIQKDTTNLSSLGVGTTTNFVLTLTNQGPSAAVLGTLSTSGLGLVAPWAYQSGGTCTSGQTLNVSSTCTLNVSFFPTQATQSTTPLSLPYADTAGAAHSTSYPLVGSAITYRFTSGQAAGVVIGQTGFITRTTGHTATTLNGPWGDPSIYQGVLYLTDYANNRIFGYKTIPTSNGVAADFVVGQTNLTNNLSSATASTLSYPWSSAVANGILAVADFNNSRVLLFNPAPTATGASATTVLGQTSFTATVATCGATSENYPTASVIGNGKLVVSDAYNNRVLIWNTIPASNVAPDLVLGQANLTTCSINTGGVSAASMSYPGDVWTNGTQLIVADSGNNRLLIWNTFPTTNGQPADLVLGQATFSGSAVNAGGAVSASGFDTSTNFWSNVTSNGVQIFYSDYNNNRILIWNSYPTTNGAPADEVIGQNSFTTNTAVNPPTSSSLSGVGGVTFYGSQFLVTDYGNNRVLIFNGQ